MDNPTSKLLVARTLVDLSTDNLPVRVMNLTNGYVSLKKGTRIAMCQPATCVRNMDKQPTTNVFNVKPTNRQIPEHLKDLYSRSKALIG